jgi:hypothetical protein
MLSLFEVGAIFSTIIVLIGDALLVWMGPTFPTHTPSPPIPDLPGLHCMGQQVVHRRPPCSPLASCHWYARFELVCPAEADRCSVLGFIVAWAQSIPASSLYAPITKETGTPYFALEMSLNVICTLLIIIPLLQTRRYVTRALGRRHGEMYTSIISIIIESALPNAVFSFIWVILYAKENYGENLIITMLLQIQVCGPSL